MGNIGRGKKGKVYSVIMNQLEGNNKIKYQFVEEFLPTVYSQVNPVADWL